MKTALNRGVRYCPGKADSTGIHCLKGEDACGGFLRRRTEQIRCKTTLLRGGIMDISAVTQITRETLYVIVITSAPLLLTSLIVGLAISIFQTVTSIQEQTLTFVPKVLSIFAMMLLMGHWMLNNMVGLMTRLWSDFSLYVK